MDVRSNSRSRRGWEQGEGLVNLSAGHDLETVEVSRVEKTLFAAGTLRHKSADMPTGARLAR